MATLLMRATDGASADKKRRARKGKNAQKKQPQRGLGVAQLEKLRLQEQSLLCPTSSYSLRLCTPAEHSHSSISRCDSDVAQTVLSLTNGPGAGAGAASSLRDTGMSRLALSGHSSTQSLSTQGKCNNNNLNCSSNVSDGGVDAKRVASRALACINQSAKFSAANVPFFSSVLATAPLQVYNHDGHGDEERRMGVVGVGHGPAAGFGEAANATPVYFLSTIHNLKEAGTPVTVNDSAGYKLHPVFKDVSRIPITITEPHYLESLLGSDVHHVPRKRIELPVVGVTPNVDKPKELPSFQSHPSNQAWSSPDKASGRKRPWLAIQENGRQVSHAQALDLNAPAGESELGHGDHHCAVVTQDIMFSESRVGAHYTTGIIRSALGNSCLPLVKLKSCSSASPWQDTEILSSASGHFSDMGLYPENGLLLKHCTSPSIAKDSFSSATGPTSYLTLNRKRCLNDPESSTTPSPVGKESICSSNFLTLGMSSSFYPVEGWHEPEESTQDTLMSMNVDVSGLKQGSSSGCEGDDGSQLQLRTPVNVKQESGAVDLEKHKSLRNGSTVQNENVLSSVPPPSNNFAGNRPLKSARIGDEDILDLRLKLAL